MACLDPEAALAARFNALASTQPRYPVLATDHALSPELQPRLLRPIGLMTARMHAADLAKQHLVAGCPSALWAATPLVVAAARHIEHRTHALWTELLFVRAH